MIMYVPVPIESLDISSTIPFDLFIPEAEHQFALFGKQGENTQNIHTRSSNGSSESNVYYLKIDNQAAHSFIESKFSELLQTKHLLVKHKTELMYQMCSQMVQEFVQLLIRGQILPLEKISKLQKTVQSSAQFLISEKQALNELIQAIADSEHLIYQHSVNVMAFSVVLAHSLGLSPSNIEDVAIASLLHDIGYTKSSVPPPYANDSVRINTPGIESHPVQSFQMLCTVEHLSQNTLDAILYHHERLDGSGFPNGLQGSQIPLHARILAFADTFEFLVNPNRKTTKMKPFYALKSMMETEKKKLDPSLFKPFILALKLQ